MRRWGKGLVVLLVALASCAAPPVGPPPSTGPGIPSAPAAPAAAPPLMPLRFGLNTPTANIAPVWVAKDLGPFAEYGIDAELVPIPGGERIVATLLAGEVPLSLLAGTGLVSAALGGADLMLYGSFANRLRYWLYARPEVTSVADLRGRRVAVTGRGGIVRRATDLTLERHGLDSTRDVTLIATGQITESVVALLSGAVDAAMLSPPGTFQAEDEGMRLLVNTHEYNFPAVISGIAGTRAWVSQHEDLTRRTLQAIAAGIAFSHRERERTLEVIARWTQTDDPALVERIYATVAPGWQRDLRVPVEAIRSELEGLADELLAARQARPERVFENRLVDALEREGFFAALGW